ncbi:MAG: DUF4437 domain-containing protein [Acidobacteria bacterium]|jgi:glyoxylate utilization-related uncharacterized protein|nr:MAG: DUF4437 domain-containing protein [Acidobacteriota bacterium]GIU82802.1 MAG: hypothetical protein KatS3mg006_1866 [Pyrinomonadaceae bacterium]
MWNRKHIEFIWFDDVKYEPFQIPGFPEGLKLKILSIDETDGALSGILSIPAGWRFDEDFVSDAQEELFVLSGDLEIAGEKLTEQFYSFRPAGAAHGRIRSEKGCEVIVMWDKKFNAHLGVKGPKSDIKTIDTMQMYWKPNFAEGPAAGISVKLLHEDKSTGGATFIVGILPNWREDRAEHHPCVEESFKLFGDMNLNTLLGNKLLMGENSYFFRPPFIKHGPMFTKKGTMSLIRTSSTLINRYCPIEEDPEYHAWLANGARLP